ncbi:MAG TPA: GntR family transcriptional regulator [Clostridiales bacterium]|nr:GntR family transcriptional regulator [Clostridiales bacterium]
MSGDTRLIKEKVFDSIFEDIIRGEYPVNTIINERMLIEKYKVSKSPVREALIELCKENILKSIPRMGYQVVQISPKEIYDILELRLIIEVAALKKTFALLDDNIIEKLEKNIQRTLEFIGEKDIVNCWNRNIGFHLLLCSFCNNNSIYNTLNDILKFCSRGAIQYYQKTWDSSQSVDRNNHISLIDALRKRDFKLAEQILGKDVSSMKDVFFN